MKALWRLLFALFLISPGLLSQEPRLEEARQLLEDGRAEDALGVLEQLLRQQPNDAAALFLRSTARFLTGETAPGRHDLERSLALDPNQRQGWLNLAGLEIMEKEYDAALAALQNAEKLDPTASDNHLNLGAVHLLRGELDLARKRFDLYIRRERSADAFYLVAINYDGSGYGKLALAHLEKAIEMDEKLRVEAANDKRFLQRFEDPDFVALVTTDQQRLPADSHKAAQTFGNLPYRADGVLLKAVLQTLQTSGRPLDHRVEVQEGWALMWSDARIKIRQLPSGLGRVEITAPAERFTAESWSRYTESIFQEISARLLVLEVKEIKRNSGGK